MLGACAGTPAAPQVTEAERLLVLVGRVVEAASAEQRRSLEKAERERVARAPSEGNRLRLAMVRAFSAALPSDLMQAHADLRALAGEAQGLSDDQRRLALMALVMVEDRLQMGAQIIELQQKIDSLTEIEASLNHGDAQGDSDEDLPGVPP